MTYEVIDNFLPSVEHSILKDAMMSLDFPWFFNSSVSEAGQEHLPAYYFVHLFYTNYAVNSDKYKFIIPLIDKIKPKAIIRIKANLYPNLGLGIKEIENQWHTDWPYPHKGAVYYINDNDGYTTLEDGTKIESKANRILLFDSSKLHKSSHCSDQKFRLTINFNYF